MAGFGQEGVHPLNVNAPPLVAPAESVATPTAVQQLVDSFRNGVISADDVLKTIAVNPVKEKAEIQGFEEMLSPEAIAARKAGVQLAGAKTTREIADTKYGGGVSAYQQYAPYFGAPSIIQDANGNPDYDAMGKQGNEYMGTMAQQNFARLQLEPDPSRTVKGVDQRTRQPVERLFNKWGDEVTPGSPRYNDLMSVISRTNNSIFGNKPGEAVVTPKPSVAAHPAAPVPIPAAPKPGDLQALLANSGLVSGSEAAQTPDDQARQILESFNAKATPTAPPEITVPQPAPAPTPSVGQYIPGSGMVTGPSQNLMNAPDIATDLRKQPEYVQWSTMMSQGGERFLNTAEQIQKTPVAEQRSGKAKMNTLDMDLAENIIKMEDPGNAIREFKWNKLSEGAPLFERLKNFKAEALRTGSLTPESRKRLIELGYEVLAAKERTVLPQLQLAKQRAEASSAPLDQIFTSRDQQILNGGTLVPAGHAAAGSAPAGELVTIPGRGKGYLNRATGMFTPAP